MVVGCGPRGEAGEAAAHAEGPDAVAPACQDLVRIALMADIPDQPVAGRLENVMEGYGELDHAQARPQMPARHRDGRDRFLAQLVGELADRKSTRLNSSP